MQKIQGDLFVHRGDRLKKILLQFEQWVETMFSQHFPVSWFEDSGENHKNISIS